MNPTCDAAAVRCGPFLYEPINGRLLRAGAELGVPPRALPILGCLVERPGLVVTKQAVVTPGSGVDACWQGLALVEGAEPRLTPVPLAGGLRLPGTARPTTELEAVIQWGRDVRQRAPVAPRPLPVVR
jgi:hypothetical protein